MQTFHARQGAGLFCAAMLLVTAAGGGLARAAEGPGPKRVLLVKTQRQDDVGGVVASRVDRALGTAIAVDSRVELVLPEGLEESAPVAPKAAPVTDEALIKADKAVDEAKALFGKEKYMDATKAFSKAMGLYEKKLALLEDFDRYVDAQLGRALAYFLAGFDDNGEDELGRVLVVRPTLVLDKRRVPKAANDALERLQMLYARAMAEPITIESGIEGPAQVFVDGVAKGKAPVTLDKLYRGTHWVRIVAEGYEPWADSFEAGAGVKAVKAKLKAIKKAAGATPTVVALTRDELIEAARTGAFGKRFDQGAGAMCAKYGLAGIFITYVRPSPEGHELAGFYFDAEAGKLAQVDPVQVDREFADLQVNTLTLAERLVGAAAAFPGGATVAGTPKVYERTARALTPTELAVAKAEADKAERARLEAERAEQARLEAERAAKAQAEADKIAAARSAKERAEAERAAKAQAEADRKAAKAQAEADRKAAAEAAAAERKAAAEAAAAERKAEAERAAAERKAAAEVADAERKAAAERAAAERKAAAEAASRTSAERSEAERLAAEQARVAAEKAQLARLAAERAEKARLEAEAAQLEADRAEAARIAAERAAASGDAARAAELRRAEAERQAAAKSEAARRAEAEREAAEWKAAAELKAEAERQSETDRLVAARIAAEKAEAARRAEAERIAAAERKRREDAARTVLERRSDGGSGVGGVGGIYGREIPPVIEDEDEFYETWWFWTLVTGALVGGGAATYFALDSGGGGTPSGFRTTVTF